MKDRCHIQTIKRKYDLARWQLTDLATNSIIDRPVAQILHRIKPTELMIFTNSKANPEDLLSVPELINKESMSDELATYRIYPIDQLTMMYRSCPNNYSGRCLLGNDNKADKHLPIMAEIHFPMKNIHGRLRMGRNRSLWQLARQFYIPTDGK